MNIQSRASEILLVIVLIGLVGFTRVYFGGPDGIMVVWKGNFGFADTFVNLGDILNLPPSAVSEHQDVFYQLQEMGMVDVPVSSVNRRKPRRVAPLTEADKTQTNDSGKNGEEAPTQPDSAKPDTRP